MKLIQNEEFNGLKLSTPIDLSSNITIVVGKNGAGKSRLLQAIHNQKVQIIQNENLIDRARIAYFGDKLQPSLTFGFDPIQYRDAQVQAKLVYSQMRGSFDPNPNVSINKLGSPVMGRRGLNLQALAHAVCNASRQLNKDVNKLDEQDICDFYSSGLLSLGSLNVTAIMREYLIRQETNEINAVRNQIHGDNRPHLNPQEFIDRFGAPPWQIFNDFLTNILDCRYHIKTPALIEFETYEAKLFRDDEKEIDPNTLSSGERTLLWLCLSMYVATTSPSSHSAELILLDEPDSTLHPQMIQKLHVALKTLSDKFNCPIILTSHSPTTVALSDENSIYKISEDSLIRIDKDAAIAELLDGIDQISINYANRRQIYVESFKDEKIYSQLFARLTQWGKISKNGISLSFIPAAAKLKDQQVKEVFESTIGQHEKINNFIEKLNGLGDCSKVLGTVESLRKQGNKTVHGIIDWDKKNRPEDGIYILGEGVFYAMESAILNPLTLALYLLKNFSSKVKFADFDLDESTDILDVYTNASECQKIVDALTQKILNLNIEPIRSDSIQCKFLFGIEVSFDKSYVHRDAHSLWGKIKEAYPFLLGTAKTEEELVKDVLDKEIIGSHGRSLPIVFLELFKHIQSGKSSFGG